MAKAAKTGQGQDACSTGISKVAQSLHSYCNVCWSRRTWYLFQYRLQGSAAFTAPCVWHDAEGAHVVAAPHDGQVGADAACWPDRQNVCIGFLCAELHIHGALMFATTSACATLQQDSLIGTKMLSVQQYQTTTSCCYKHPIWLFVSMCTCICAKYRH